MIRLRDDGVNMVLTAPMVLTDGVNGATYGVNRMVVLTDRPPEVDPPKVDGVDGPGMVSNPARRRDRHAPGYMRAYMHRRRSQDRVGKAEAPRNSSVT
jgi:hypothetical protein